MDALNLAMRQSQIAGLGMQPAATLILTSVLREHSAEDLTEAVQKQEKLGFVMCFLVQLLQVPQLPLPLLHIVLEAWWLAVLASRVATQP
jgi:uncharacterized membrane protein YdjX (TVP38/TMEM64 family)